MWHRVLRRPWTAPYQRFATELLSIRHFSTTRNNTRIFLSTSVTEPFSVPLTLTDVFLRHEQLPFAYAFRATLDSDKLVASFQEVLKRYPILGARVDFLNGKVPTLECNASDTVPFSFGTSRQSLDEWLGQKRSGNLQHSNWHPNGGPPILSPLFDDLESARWEHGEVGDIDNVLLGGNESIEAATKANVATVRVTYFRGGGTSIGINISHLLGDANTCFRICQVWGRAMRMQPHPPGASNNRSKATLTGMVTPEMAGILNLGQDAVTDENATAEISFVAMIGSYWNGFLGLESLPNVEETTIALDSEAKDDSHEYVLLRFSPELLLAMKNYGTSRCASVLAADESDDPNYGIRDFPTFVSTNDMITAFGWIVKRHIAEQADWNLSMVVNLRQRGGIHGFSCLEDETIGLGLFGNALTSLVAKLPPSQHGKIRISEVGDAAIAIRQSFSKKLEKIEDLLVLSQAGTASPKGDQGSCFSSTSWMQFPLWDINFCDEIGSVDGQKPPGSLSGFYGRPSYALPAGDTYSSIIVPNFSGGCTYKMLAPTQQVQSILRLHERMSNQFMQWEKEQLQEFTVI